MARAEDAHAPHMLAGPAAARRHERERTSGLRERRLHREHRRVVDVAEDGGLEDARGDIAQHTRQLLAEIAAYELRWIGSHRVARLPPPFESLVPPRPADALPAA